MKKKRSPHNYSVPIFKTIPDGWVIDTDATNAPLGYVFINNNKSRFGGERKTGLIKLEGF